jgi:hypothetical protein
MLRRALVRFSVAILPGVLVYLLLFVASVVFHASADYMGVEDSSITDRVLALFESQIIAQQLDILALHVLIGGSQPYSSACAPASSTHVENDRPCARSPTPSSSRPWSSPST